VLKNRFLRFFSIAPFCKAKWCNVNAASMPCTEIAGILARRIISPEFPLYKSGIHAA